VPFLRECGKIFTVGQVTDDNMAHVHTHTHTHTHTHRRCNTVFLHDSNVCKIVMLHIYYQSCFQCLKLKSISWLTQ